MNATSATSKSGSTEQVHAENPSSPAKPQAGSAAVEMQRGRAIETPALVLYDPRQQAHKVDPSQENLATIPTVRYEALFGAERQRVLNVQYTEEHAVLKNGVKEVPHEGLNLVSLELFKKPEIFLGFGKPNVFLCYPNSDGTGFAKYNAFMFRRDPSFVADTKGRVQSGFFLRFRNLPAEALINIRAAADAQSGERHWSCANANAKVLAAAGFSLRGGKKLESFYRPWGLFRTLIKNGLSYQGKPVEFDILRTTSAPLEEHFAGVIVKTGTSPFRLVKKTLTKVIGSGAKAKVPLIPAREVIAQPEFVDRGGNETTLRISRASSFGVTVRQFWGQHTLWEAVPKGRSELLNQLLPEQLQAFPQKSPDFVTRVKQNVLFAKAPVGFIFRNMAESFEEVGSFSPQSLAAMMLPSTKEKPQIYNIVISGSFVRIALIDVKSKLPDWVLSKHVLISNYDKDVRFAGETWLEFKNGRFILHVNNNSGTYRPTKEQLTAAAKYLSRIFPGITVQEHVA